MDLITICDPATGAEATVAPGRGMNCFRWTVPTGRGPWDVLWAEPGFESGAGRPSASGVPLLLPHPGRIDAAQFEFGGKTYQLEPSDAHGNAIHGFVHRRAWRVVESLPAEVTGEFQLSRDAPEDLPRWPSDFRARVRMRIAAGRLTTDIQVENAGQADLPFALGTHAYFRVPLESAGSRADVELFAPADREWLLDGRMLPTGELRPLDADCDLRQGVGLESRPFDNPFAAAPFTEGVSGLRDRRTGRTLSQRCGEEFTCYVVYTPGHGEAVCIEPCTSVPDPYRLESQGVAVGLRVLAPGESFATTIELQADPAD
ncbi:Aldose 1-epimerase [Pirellulimonas nuda]|uniref:Aldose 1-epimerase n=1 Tax=Pirellulimonas nuda TaxID=2528009 RepID=A0A518DGJ6_9BACT|nr:aldose 1-epimerase [Pirellulimonas nuda]QDU90594.1 Aldose 1-epimerase [Pirellulimonas nuda]